MYYYNNNYPVKIQYGSLPMSSVLPRVERSVGSRADLHASSLVRGGQSIIAADWQRDDIDFYKRVGCM